MVIYWNIRNKSFLEEGLELSSCMDGGQTYEEAIQNDLISVKDWIETIKPFVHPKSKSKLIDA